MLVPSCVCITCMYVWSVGQLVLKVMVSSEDTEGVEWFAGTSSRCQLSEN